MITHLVWDWNGTLLDDAELIITATSASMVALGREPVTTDEYRTHFARPLRRFYERLLDRPVAESEAAELDQDFHGRYVELVESAALRNDAVAALTAAGDAGLDQSLLSMWPHDYLVSLVERLGLTGFFSLINGNRVRSRRARPARSTGTSARSRSARARS